MPALVSMIILCVDRFDQTERVLHGLAETNGEFETILIDNGSRPETVEKIRELSSGTLASRQRLRCLFNSRNRGVASGRNQGAALATGDYLLFLDNDVRILRCDWLSRLLQAYSTCPEAGVVGGTLLNWDLTVQFAGAAVDARGRLSFDTSPGTGLRETMVCLGACLSTTRECWDQVGGFDPAYDPMDYEDVDYCLQVRQSGRPVLLSLDAQLLHEAHSTTGTSGHARIRSYLSSGRIFRNRWEQWLSSMGRVSEGKKSPCYCP